MINTMSISGLTFLALVMSLHVAPLRVNDVAAQPTNDSVEALQGVVTKYRDEGEEKNGLVVDFSAEPTAGLPPLSVQFTDLSDGGGESLTHWEWEFGDGQSSFDQHPEHVYELEGVFSVTLTVSAADNTEAIAKHDYIVVESALSVVSSGILVLLAVAALTVIIAYRRKKLQRA